MGFLESLLGTLQDVAHRNSVRAERIAKEQLREESKHYDDLTPEQKERHQYNQEVLEELHLDPRFTLHYTILENGVIEGASINGTTLVYSEELNGGEFAILTLHKSAIGFGTQLQETEAMRLESDFADGIRGLQVAGAKTLRPKAVVKYVQE